MPLRHEDLTPEQRRAVTHPAGPLIVVGGAGTGKTTVLAERFAWLASGDLLPESVLAVARSRTAADALRSHVEDRLDGGWEELCVLTVDDLCRRLLRDEALEAGIDPLVVVVSPGDRVAMLLERIDELTLRRHDLRGNPAALLRSVVARIDRLKEEAIGATDYDAWARGLPDDDDARRARAEHEREFAGLYLDHERMLAQAGAIDHGELLARVVALLGERPHVRARVAARWRHVLADDYQDLSYAQARLITLLAADHGNLTVAGDDDQAIRRLRGAAAKNLRDLAAERPDATEIRLERSLRCPPAIVAAANAVVAANPGRIAKRLEGRDGADGTVAFWRCANEHAQAQAVAREAERLIRAGAAPERIAVLVRSVRNEGQPIAAALDERSVPYRVEGAAAFFARAEVRDVLAWLRLLVDPSDAGAVVRALARPPVELRAADLARCIQIARRRRLDMVSALVAATESPQIPPESRERIQGFLRLHRDAAEALDTARPDLFVHRLVERLGLRRQQLFAAQADVVERLRAISRLSELAGDYVRSRPNASARDLAHSLTAVAEAGMGDDDEDAVPAGRAGAVRVMAIDAAQGIEADHVFVLGMLSARMPGARRAHVEPIPDELVHERLPPDSRAAHVAEMRRLAHVAMTRAREGLVIAYPAASERGAAQPPSPFAEEARAAVGGEWVEREEELFGPAESLHAAFRALRDDLLGDVASVGASLGELRFDTDLDIAHAVARYLELIKLGALMERPAGQSIADALPEINARLAQAVTPVQREILQTSSLDEALLEAEHADSVRAAARAARAEPSLEPFLPKKGAGLVLSATDIETYRTCPLKYKFARVFRIPSEPTTNQRFGIVVHQVLERWHRLEPDGGRAASEEEILGLLDAAWRRAGFGSSDEELQLHAKAVGALRRYRHRFQDDESRPVWFEKGFTFRMGPHTLRGRVDRVDLLPDGGYELIDYKTGRPKSASQLRDDVQLSLYAVGAREAWQLDAERQAYHYVLDDEKVPVPTDEIDRDWIAETVMTVGEGILGQGFEPTPSYAACSICDYRIACPAAER
ncbi:MAG TPA: ATP-dependent DNA helicase [Solirubrobacteraceae bacterium]|nr:ATP-dependent DNA helicase [Solirubrobacteraceae bacterium]